ncbi:MAG: glycosyltransferase family 2 protein [Firmicutes bacterium]|nr:glycosyltransferase family 2 protein [Bacillota bacterium]
MFFAVVPARNEGRRIAKVIAKLVGAVADIVVPVVNGSTDSTLNEIMAFSQDEIRPLMFTEALGPDVPRAVGAAYALREGATGVLFVDGDMTQVPRKDLQTLKAAVNTGGVDLALTNCYPPGAPPPEAPVVKRLVYFREELNKCLGLPELGSASPAHGPHAVSRRLLEIIPIEELAKPPVALARAARAGLKVTAAVNIPHRKLGSPSRGGYHSERIASTIIGDHLEALAVCRDFPRSREDSGVYYDGYDSSRRIDILLNYLSEKEPSGP